MFYYDLCNAAYMLATKTTSGRCISLSDNKLPECNSPLNHFYFGVKVLKRYRSCLHQFNNEQLNIIDSW
jgi:hypothetical protein